MTEMLCNSCCKYVSCIESLIMLFLTQIDFYVVVIIKYLSNIKSYVEIFDEILLVCFVIVLKLCFLFNVFNIFSFCYYFSNLVNIVHEITCSCKDSP